MRLYFQFCCFAGLLVLASGDGIFLSAYSASFPVQVTTADPPMLSKLREVPSYNITITSASSGTWELKPSVASIPLNLTVLWVNNDGANHTVTSSGSPENFDSKIILANGGWYAHQFTHAGTYHYSDTLDSSLQGTINVGNTTQKGYYMNMLIGGVGTLPFDASSKTSFVVSFVPKLVSIPPVQGLKYNVTVSNDTAVLCRHSFVTESGILDLELLPLNATAGNATKPIASQFTTWGPDFRGHHDHSGSGTFHLQGPIMTKNVPYYLTVRILSQGNHVYTQPQMTDKFTLSSVSDPSSTNTTITTGTDSNSPTSSLLFLPPKKNTG
ncbi:MAG: hypothetical protein ABI361_09740 [Nitrososphaera sp.]|jgi:plastocyanin